jgi:hypothetical protein
MGPLLLLAAVVATPIRAESAEHRGLWMQALHWQGPDSCRLYRQLCDTANLNAVYPCVAMEGEGSYPSTYLAPAAPGGFDVLGCLLEEYGGLADVHPWFSLGPMPPPDSASPNWLASHPELGFRDASGYHVQWMDFGCAEARDWMLGMILEACCRYGLDGVHLDYIRYPCSGMGCWCEECLAAYEEAYGPPPVPHPDRMAFPTFARLGVWGVAEATTAEVLVEMSDGSGTWPGVMLNRRGDGLCLLLNWRSFRGNASYFGGSLHSVLQAALDSLGQPSEPEAVLDHDGLATTAIGSRLDWMGVEWEPLPPEEVSGLSTDRVLICPDLPLADQQLAGEIDDWVVSGGNVVFLGGVGGGMQHPVVRQLVGGSGCVVSHDVMLMEPCGQHPWVATAPPLSITRQQALEQVSRWDSLQAGMVSDFVGEVSEAVHQGWPGRWVSAAVFYLQGPADNLLQDWTGWPGERLDYVMPMAYVEDSLLLQGALQWYGGMELLEPALCLPGLGPTHAGLTPEELAGQIGMTRSAGAAGQILFCEDFLTPESAGYLRDHVYPEAVPPAYPEQTGVSPPREEGAGPFVRCSPNPAAGAVKVSWRPAGSGPCLVRVFDMSGRLAATLARGCAGRGGGEAVWNARDSEGTGAPRGVYVVRLSCPGGTASAKLVMLGE